jgi:hypothetical protein
MLEFFQYATSGFWTFCGIAILISLIFSGLINLVVGIIKSLRK